MAGGNGIGQCDAHGALMASVGEIKGIVETSTKALSAATVAATELAGQAHARVTELDRRFTKFEGKVLGVAGTAGAMGAVLGFFITKLLK